MNIPKKKHTVVMAVAPPSLMPSTWLMARSDLKKISMKDYVEHHARRESERDAEHNGTAGST